MDVAVGEDLVFREVSLVRTARRNRVIVFVYFLVRGLFWRFFFKFRCVLVFASCMFFEVFFE